MTTTIYQIYCKDPKITETYIGSTKNLENRKRNHKSSCNNEKCKDFFQPVYQFIRINGREKNKDEINRKKREKRMEELHKKQMVILLSFLDVE